MDGFWQSLLPFFRKFGLETILILIALVIALFSFLGFTNQQSIQKQNVTPIISPLPLIQNYCLIDISGAVNKPNVYQLACGKRIIDAVKLAGGLSEEADKPFIARNFNFTRHISDQEKIHIPFIWEVNEGIFLENKRTIDYISPQTTEQQAKESNDKISINLSSAEELEILPGIGKATAQKIVDNRPYESINDLVIKKVVSKTVFEKIKANIVE